MLIMLFEPKGLVGLWMRLRNSLRRPRAAGSESGSPA